MNSGRRSRRWGPSPDGGGPAEPFLTSAGVPDCRARTRRHVAAPPPPAVGDDPLVGLRLEVHRSAAATPCARPERPVHVALQGAPRVTAKGADESLEHTHTTKVCAPGRHSNGLLGPAADPGRPFGGSRSEAPRRSPDYRSVATGRDRLADRGRRNPVGRRSGTRPGPQASRSRRLRGTRAWRRGPREAGVGGRKPTDG